MTPRTAILLAAGRARRLGPLTQNRPKCLLEIGGRTLLEHQILVLRECGVEEIVIVVGYWADLVRERIGPEARYVLNEEFDVTNSLFSLTLALPHAPNGFVLTNGDVLFHPELLQTLIRSPYQDALLYEVAPTLGEEEMKVRVKDGRVEALGKTLPHGSYHGENLGLLKFSATGAALLAAAADRLSEDERRSAWAPRAFDALCAEHPLHGVPTRGLPWIEIDFPEDLERARRTVWPRIEKDVLSRQRPA